MLRTLVSGLRPLNNTLRQNVKSANIFRPNQRSFVHGRPRNSKLPNIGEEPVDDISVLINIFCGGAVLLSGCYLYGSITRKDEEKKDHLVPWTEYTGKEFNRITKGKKFVKVTNKGEKHNDLQYKDGLNIDHNKLESRGFHGIHFVEIHDVCHYLGYGENIREITVPDNATVVCNHDLLDMGHVFRTNKIIFGKKTKIQDHDMWMDNELCALFMKKSTNPREIMEFVKNPSIEVYIEFMLNRYGGSLRQIPEDKITKDIADIAFGCDAENLPIIPQKYHTPEMIEKFALNKYSNIGEVGNPSEELCLKAMEKDPRSYEFIQKHRRTAKIKELHNKHLVAAGYDPIE